MQGLPLVSIIIPTHNRKEKLIRLVNSILESDYPKDKLEIIVVDDASTDGTAEEISKLFPFVKLIRNEKELFLAGSRNVGVKNAHGEYLLLVDDDNVVDKKCIKELVKVFEDDSSVGVAAPIMYYLKQPERVWCTGVKRSMVTSFTTLVMRNKINTSGPDGLIESDDAPNAFMVKKKVVEKIGLFEEKLFPIHYDEADFGERVRRAGFRIVFNPRAKVYHDIPLPEEVKDKARALHLHNKLRAYYAARNRIIFHKKYSRRWQFLIFILIFNWLIMAYYLKIILINSNEPIINRVKVATSYLKGVIDGLKWVAQRSIIKNP